MTETVSRSLSGIGEFWIELPHLSSTGCEIHCIQPGDSNHGHTNAIVRPLRFEDESNSLRLCPG